MRLASFILLVLICGSSFGQVIYPPSKAVLDFYYLSKQVEFHGDVSGTYNNIIITNFEAITSEPRYELWEALYGDNITAFYIGISNAYYSGLVAIATNTPEDEWGIYYNATDGTWYSEEKPDAGSPEFDALFEQMYLLCDYLPCGMRRYTLGDTITGEYAMTLSTLIAKESN